MDYHIICPYCEYKLIKAKGVAKIETVCPRCHAKLIIEIKDGKVVIQRIDEE